MHGRSRGARKREEGIRIFRVLFHSFTRRLQNNTRCLIIKDAGLPTLLFHAGVTRHPSSMAPRTHNPNEEQHQRKPRRKAKHRAPGLFTVQKP